MEDNAEAWKDIWLKAEKKRTCNRLSLWYATPSGWALCTKTCIHIFKFIQIAAFRKEHSLQECQHNADNVWRHSNYGGAMVRSGTPADAQLRWGLCLLDLHECALVCPQCACTCVGLSCIFAEFQAQKTAIWWIRANQYLCYRLHHLIMKTTTACQRGSAQSHIRAAQRATRSNHIPNNLDICSLPHYWERFGELTHIRPCFKWRWDLFTL